jgi:hypothetical protein
MSDVFVLTLDTTSPILEIFAPTHVQKNALEEVTVLSNEEVASSEIYAIDSSGARHDFIFENEGTSLRGDIDFGHFPIGRVVIYAIGKDEVLNTSEIAFKEIFVGVSSDVVFTISESVRSSDTAIETGNIASTYEIREYSTSEAGREFIVNIPDR